MVKNLTIIINDPPYGVERAWNALRLAAASISEAVGLNVNLFLLGDAVTIAKKGQAPPEGFYNLEKMLTDLIKKGVKVRICGTCVKSRGLTKEDLVDGAEISGMLSLANWIKDSDAVISI